MSLRAKDLIDLVKPVFEVDSFSSKMGADKDVVVLSFTVDQKEPADDLVTFCEMGYSFVLDADVTPGELDDGTYRVFVEIQRNKHISEQVCELLDGVKKLTGHDDLRFRYYKSFKSLPADQSTLEETIPSDANSYETTIQENAMNNFTNFFSKSTIDKIGSLTENSIKFKKVYAEPLTMKVIDFGKREDVYQRMQGPIRINSSDISECIYLTKYLGNYNITKIGEAFIFENQGYAVAFERI
jgi:hypothetical protein